MMVSSPLPPGSPSRMNVEAVKAILSLVEFFGNPEAVKVRIAEYEAARVAAVEAADKASKEAEAALLKNYAEREAAITAKERKVEEALADVQRRAAEFRALVA